MNITGKMHYSFESTFIGDEIIKKETVGPPQKHPKQKRWKRPKKVTVRQTIYYQLSSSQNMFLSTNLVNFSVSAQYTINYLHWSSFSKENLYPQSMGCKLIYQNSIIQDRSQFTPLQILASFRLSIVADWSFSLFF